MAAIHFTPAIANARKDAAKNSSIDPAITIKAISPIDDTVDTTFSDNSILSEYSIINYLL